MAVVYSAVFIDDFDGKELDRDEAVSIKFSYRGKDYSIDLSAENAALFDDAIEPFRSAATRVKGDKKKQIARTSGGRTDTKAIREWANANGHTVSDHGRIPADIVEAYDAAH